MTDDVNKKAAESVPSIESHTSRSRRIVIEFDKYDSLDFVERIIIPRSIPNELEMVNFKIWKSLGKWYVTIVTRKRRR